MTSTQELKHVNEAGLGFAVEFKWQSDRYQHTIYALSGDKKRALLRSVEGDSQTDWPESPALQQLSLESSDGNPVAFGVGMAGSSHYSASLMILDSPRLVCEIACQAKSPPQHLGSAYDFATEYWDMGNGLELSALPRVRLGMSLGGKPVDPNLVSDDDGLLRLAPLSPLDEPGTHTWKYEVFF